MSRKLVAEGYGTMDERYPRVLVVSHQCFSTTTAMGKTVASLFDGWPTDRVAQLFFRNEIPDSPVCRNYFRVTDLDLIRAAVRGDRARGGRIRTTSVGQTERPCVPNRSWLESRAYELGSRRIPIVNLLRDAIWRTIGWESPLLGEWIQEFSPDVVLLVPGEYSFAYQVGHRIATKHRVPLVLYFTDDYFRPRAPLSPSYWLMYWTFYRRARSVIGDSSALLVIGERMADEYAKRFHKRCHVFKNSTDEIDDPAPTLEGRGTVRLAYVGSIHSNRWKSLERIARSLGTLKATRGLQGYLSIYTAEKPSDRVLRALTVPGVSSWAGSLNAEGVKAVQRDADILVHVEAFDERNRRLTRLSISTKIAEYLSRGKCILAFGPREVASIQYLSAYSAAKVVVDPGGLMPALGQLISDESLRRELGRRARELAERFHRRDLATRSFADLMRSIAYRRPSETQLLTEEYRSRA